MHRTPNGYARLQEQSLPSSTTSTQTFRRFSPSRRMFCLFTVFDFLFTLLAWVIYTHAFSDGLKKSLSNEVTHYTLKTSLFDLVLLSLWRMVVLLLAYALFHSRKWYTIAVVTTVSTGFLLTKVVFFSFTKTESHPMDYIILIMSFILCWVETWFLDFKVIPAELKADQRSLMESLDTTAGERRPLLDEQYPSLYHTRTWLSEHASFYTPHGSSRGSLYSSDDEPGNIQPEVSVQDQAYQLRAKETFETAWNLLNMTDGWRLEKNKDGITVESCIHNETGKMFKVQCTVDARPKDVFSRIVLHVEDSPKWNASVAESRILHEIDHCTDICYNATAETAGGLVTSRDFVNLRHWQKKGNAYMSCNVSVAYDGMPPVKQHIRGENHPGGWVFAEKDGYRNKTDFIMLVNTDLKGWLPQYLIDQAMTGVLYGTADSLRKYVHANSTPDITVEDNG